MRVTLVGHTYVAEINHEKLEALVSIPEIQLQLIVPTRWRERELGRLIVLTRRSDPRYEIVAIPPLVQWGGTLFLLEPRALWRAIRRFDPDLIHLEQVPYTLIASEVALFSQCFRKPLLIFTWENLNRHYLFPFSALNAYVLNASQMAIGGNHDAERVLRAKGFRGPIAVLPQLGVNPERFSPGDGMAVRRRLDLDGAFIIGYVGRLVWDKGVHLLIEAFSQFGDDTARLLIVGSGPLKGELIATALALKVQGRIRWVDAVPHEAVVEYLRAMDVLVLPSVTTSRWKEQFGHVLIEAMACEVAVVGSDSGEIPNVITDAGLVFPEGDAKALAGCLDQYRQNPALHALLARRGRDRVLAHYTHQAIAQRTVALYQQILASGCSHEPLRHVEKT